MQDMVPLERVSLVDQVFDRLYGRVLSLELPPGAKISEAEVSKQLGVSRQVVRDAFYRLSLLGFLVIQPQKATVVSRISEQDILQARFMRTAIEVEVARIAVDALTNADFEALEALIVEQEMALKAEDHAAFHRLDNAFHQQLCERAGFGFAWSTVQEKKAHTDRVRFLSLSFASERALAGHREILRALRQRDTARAAAAMRAHLSEIESVVATLRAANHAWFTD